jgi:hypothetical protein
VIDTRDFTQRYFPTEVDVDFSIVPEDELPGLVEEALALPAIDFQASEAALDLTAVLIVAPVPRAEFRAVLAKLTSRMRTLKPAAPNLLAQRKPLEILQRLRLPLPFTQPDVASPSDAEWARLAQLPTLWFVRRRNLAYRDDLVGNGVAATGEEEVALEKAVRDRVTELGLTPRLNSVMTAATSKATWSVVSLLALPAIAASPTLTAAALGALQAKISADPGKRLTNAAALSVGNEIKSGATGSGLVTLEAKLSGRVSAAALLHIASNDAWRKLDSSARLATGAQLNQLSARLDVAPPAVTAAPVAVAPVAVAPAAVAPTVAATPATAAAAATTTAAAPALGVGMATLQTPGRIPLATTVPTTVIKPKSRGKPAPPVAQVPTEGLGAAAAFLQADAAAPPAEPPAAVPDSPAASARRAGAARKAVAKKSRPTKKPGGGPL